MFRKSKAEAMAKIKEDWEARKCPQVHAHVWVVSVGPPLAIRCGCGETRAVEEG